MGELWKRKLKFFSIRRFFFHFISERENVEKIIYWGKNIHIFYEKEVNNDGSYAHIF